MKGRSAVVISDEEDEHSGLWTNPFHSNWSVFRWDMSYLPEYRKIRKGSQDIINNKMESYKKALYLADKSLELIDTVKDSLPPGAYDFFKFKLEENTFHLTAMCEMELAWLKASNNAYYCKAGDEKYKISCELSEHLTNLGQMTERYNESVECVWKGKHYTLRRGVYLDIPGFLAEFRRYWNINEG
jgi:hypothetical protein